MQEQEPNWAWIEAQAVAQGATLGAVQKWRERGAVPWKWIVRLGDEAERLKIELPKPNGG